MRIWVDLTNRPARARHAAGDRRAARRGARCGSRCATSPRRVRCASASARARRSIGRHRGGRWRPRPWAGLALGARWRAGRAAGALRRRARPRIERRHGGGAGCCASRARRCSTTSGRRSSTTSTAASRRRSWCPRRSRPSGCYRYGAARQDRRYPGLKEEYYLADFEPDPAVLEELWPRRAQPIAVVRTPPAVSLYHRFENDVFADVLEPARDADGRPASRFIVPPAQTTRSA